MNYYLAQFRDQVFNGSISLYKRVFFKFLILNIIIGLISLAVYTPLLLKLFSWNLSDLLDFQSKIQNMGDLIKQGEDIQTVFAGIFGQPNYFYILPLLFFSIFMGIWSLNLYYQLNDAEIRDNNSNILNAIKNSFSKQLLSILGFMVLYYLLCFASAAIFMFVVAMLMALNKVIGILFGFIGFFYLLFFIIRFSLGFAAISHGKMNISEAFGYSFTHITFKRAAVLFLMGTVVLVVMGIASGIGESIVNLIANRDHSNPVSYYIIKQIFGTIMGVIASTYIYAGSSALYFRYSNDEEPNEGTADSEETINY